MEQNSSDTTSDEELLLELTPDENNDLTVIQRLKEFAFYLTENVETNLNFCLKLLEERTLPKKPNSNPSTLASLLFSPIPYIGKGASTLIKEGEIFILNKIDKQNSRTLADLVYYYSDNRDKIRHALIEASADLFYSFEDQFKKLSCDGGARRAMQKLAKDAANRIFTHFLETNQSKELSKDDLTRGAIFGDSLRNKSGSKSGRTVKDKKHDNVWKTASIYKKVGLYSEETSEYFTSSATKSDKYGYRRLFDWESLEEVRQNYKTETAKTPLVYTLRKTELQDLYSAIREYIMQKTVEEEAKLDREKKHLESLEDRKLKHDEIISVFSEKFGAIIELLSNSYTELLTQHKIVATIQNNTHDETKVKLEEIHRDVIETKMKQNEMQITTVKIEKKIEEIEMNNNNKENREISRVVTINIGEVVAGVAKNLEHSVKDNHEVKKVVKNVRNIEPEVRRNIKKFFKKF